MIPFIAVAALLFSLFSALFCVWAVLRLYGHKRRYSFEEIQEAHLLGFISLRGIVWSYGIVIVGMSLVIGIIFLPLTLTS
jgi:hypothetical protein